jgi:photosystem II stability/assembly factor-like uncharacterized protein
MASAVLRALAGVLSIAFAITGASAEPDVLERPALRSVHAARSVMLAVAAAGQRLVCVGERGLILLSDDGGVAWRQASVPVSVSLTHVHFPTQRLGWAVGHAGVVLHSADGGESWVKQLDGREAARLALESAMGGADGRLRTEAERLVADGPDKPFLAVHFFDGRRGIVVGAYGLAFATEDGGNTWRSFQDRIDNPKGRHLYAIHARGGQVLLAGEQGALLRGDSFSLRFTELASPYAGTYFGVLSAAPGEIFVFGLRGNAFWSGDGGHVWKKTDTGAPNGLTAGRQLPGGRLAVVDDAGRILKSHDGGRTITPVPVERPFPFTGIVQTADGALVVSGARGLARIGHERSGSQR